MKIFNKKSKTKIYRSSALFAAVAIFTVQFFYVLSPLVFANDHDWAALRLDRMTTTVATGGTVMMRTGTTNAQTETDVQVTFPGNGTQGAASFGVNSTPSNWDVNTSNLPANCTAWPGIGTEATAVTGATVTFSSTNLSDSTTYCFNFVGTSTLTNPTSAGSGSTLTGNIKTRMSGPTDIFTTRYALTIVSSNEDQITVTATVDPSFTFDITTCGSNTDALGVLSTGSIVSSSTACRVSIITNAASGWIVWAKDSQQGLRSTSQSYTIPGSSTMDDNCTGLDDDIAAGTEGFGADVEIITDAGGGGTVLLDGDFNCGAGFVGDYDTNFTELATADGPANGDIIEIIHRAAISGLTPAATDYSNIVTVSAAGQF